MRLTIVPSDKKVVIDGVGKFPLDLSTCEIPNNVWALQWYGTEGEIEFDGRPKPPNEIITTLPDWANACVVIWEKVILPEPPTTTIEAQPATTGTQSA